MIDDELNSHIEEFTAPPRTGVVKILAAEPQQVLLDRFNNWLNNSVTESDFVPARFGGCALSSDCRLLLALTDLFSGSSMFVRRAPSVFQCAAELCRELSH